jgi:hypothetical protein
MSWIQYGISQIKTVVSCGVSSEYYGKFYIARNMKMGASRISRPQYLHSDGKWHSSMMDDNNYDKIVGYYDTVQEAEHQLRELGLPWTI